MIEIQQITLLTALRELLALRKQRHHFVVSEETGRCCCDQCAADGNA